MHHGGNWWCQSTNNISSRLYISHALLDGTNLMLYSINEAVLVSLTNLSIAVPLCICFHQIRWYKNATRREEIAMLMQGLALPTQRDFVHH